MDNYDKTRKFFSENAGNYAKSRSHANDEDLQMLLGMLGLKDDMVALDVATGSGFTAAGLAGKVKTVYAMDMVENMLKETEKLALRNNIVNIIAVKGYAEEMPFEDKTFDIVTCRRAAHHFADRKKFASEAYRVLKPGGKLGIDDMTAQAEFIDKLNELERIRDPSHMLAASPDQWENILLDTGFKNVKKEIYSRRVSFKEWIYPVLEDSREGVMSSEYLKNSGRDFLAYIEWDGKSFIKRWIV
ncbi:MAG: methyltransferase domain-containing protein, partial [Ferroplasma sp.]